MRLDIKNTGKKKQKNYLKKIMMMFLLELRFPEKKKLYLQK